jgi:branched-chain amino acid transport system substrate-binding protein
MNTSVRRSMSRILCAVSVVAFGMAQAAAQDGITRTEIILGQSMDQSGPDASREKLVKQGGDQYLDYVNRKGGVNGRKIRVISLDNKGANENTVADVARLVEKDKVFAMFLVSGTSDVAAILPYIAEHKVPLFGITTGSVSLRKPHPYLVHYKASHADEMRRVAEHLAATGNEKVGVIYLNNGFGNEGLAAAESAFAECNLEIVARAGVQEDANDYTEAVKAVADAKPQAVVLISGLGPAPAIVNAYRAFDQYAWLYGLSVLDSNSMHQELGDKARGMIISQTVPYPWDRGDRVAAEYRSVMESSGSKDLSVAGLEGFIAARMLVKGLKAAGMSPTRERFAKMLGNIADQNLDLYRYSYRSSDDGVTHFAGITVIGDGGKLMY